SCRLYIGSITREINETNLARFLNTLVMGIDGDRQTRTSDDPVLAVQCNYEEGYAIVDFCSAEDATAAMAFDGITFLNGPLRIRRLMDYGGVDSPAPSNVHVPGVVSTNVADHANKVPIRDLPMYLNEWNITHHGSETSTDPYEQFPEIPKPILPAGNLSNSNARTLLMLDIGLADDSVDDQEYEDIRKECTNLGAVEDLRIPQPVEKGVRCVYVKFYDPQTATAALKSFAGQSFAGHSIIATLL
ncbi:uncharacterized protein FOMMEDRAFT_45167, partial [Fomitiporia mediterranea MF3/22]|uniref:uncharacterized protein n=1 Tax=Fomitiporia mediterranea (strain MF3/22) TaxID=694068 RepID=UPI0004408DA7